MELGFKPQQSTLTTTKTLKLFGPVWPKHLEYEEGINNLAEECPIQRHSIIIIPGLLDGSAG